MTLVTLATAATLALAACGKKVERTPCPPPPPGAGAAGGVVTLAPPANPVQAEMRLLAAALETAVRGVGIGDVAEVEHALHRVHAAKEATAAAIRDGGWKPAQNPDKLDTFVAMDEAFHEHLGRLVAASAARDVAATAAALGDALKACDGCHTMFRAPGPVAPAASAPAPAPAPAPAHEH